MFSVPFIVASLFSQKSLEEQQTIVNGVLEKGSEYYHRTWNGVVNAEMLKDEQVKLNLIKTIFFSQTRYWGAIDEILRSLSEWSKGTLIFIELTLIDDQLFYLRYFTFLGFINFAEIETERQLHLLHGECLLIAVVWDVPIYTSVQSFFEKFTDLNFLKEYSKMFSTIIENNQSLVGTEGKGGKTIGEWTKQLYNYKEAPAVDRVDIFIKESFEVQRLSEDDKIILAKILTLYWGLKVNFIWREVSNVVVAGIERKKEGSKPVVLENEYLNILSEADKIGFEVWLKSYQDVVEWIDLTDKTEAFVLELFKIIRKKIDFENHEQVDLLLKFISELKEDGLENIDEIIFFDEETGELTWNENVVPPAKNISAQKNINSDKKIDKDQYTKLKEGLST